MNNKILVQLVVPEIEETYDIYIPITKKIGEVINLLNKAIGEFTNGDYTGSIESNLYNAKTGERYPIDELLYNTTIRNGEKIVLY